LWKTPSGIFLCIYLYNILVVLVVGAVDKLISAFSPCILRVFDVDNYVNNYVENMWMKCGKLF